MTTRLKRIQACSALFFLIALPPAARADGGVVRMRQAQGPFIVTIFTASEAVKDTPADISVLVQDRNSNEAILDAEVNLQFAAPASPPEETVDAVCSQTPATAPAHPAPFEVPATRKQASNKLLYAAQIHFPAPGLWQLQAFIKRGNDAAKIACGIPVAPPPQQWTALLPCLVLPPFAVALFALNQRLRRELWDKPIPNAPTSTSKLVAPTVDLRKISSDSRRNVVPAAVS